MNFLLAKGYGFKCGTEVRVAPGILQECGPLLRDLGVSRLGLIIDSNLADNPRVLAAEKAVAASGIAVRNHRFACCEPGIAEVSAVTDVLSGDPVDGIMGIGGGSTLDLAKAVAVLLTNGNEPRKFLGMDKLTRPGLPCVVVPSIAGSGAEITPSAVLLDKEKDFKGGINGRYVAPALALLDAELYASCPVGLAAVSVYDAMTHAIESYQSTSGSPLSRTFSREGLKLLVNNLPRLQAAPGDLKARENLLLGSLLSIMGLMHALPGAIAGFAYPLGIFFAVPHGLAQAVVMNECLRIRQERNPEIYAEFYDLFDDAKPGLARSEKSGLFVRRMEELYAALRLPRDLRAYGLRRDNVTQLIDSIAGKKALQIDIVPFTRAEVVRVIDSIL